MSKPTEFINVEVVASKKKDTDGNITYETIFKPERVSVKSHDAVINYQLVDPTPEGVQFVNVDIEPEQQTQLSNPSVGRSGKLLTLSDVNTTQEEFNLTFHFKDSDGIKFFVDPEIDNFPPPEVEI